MKILSNNEIDSKIWNNFVGNNTFHKFEWLDIIQKSYGLEPCYLMIYDENKFALLPSFKINNKLISLPYTYVVGFLYNSDELYKKLQEYIKEKSLIVQYKYVNENIQENSTVTAILNNESSDFFWKGLSSNMRNQIRKSKQSNLSLKNEDSVNNFYDIYSKKMHILGTPAHAKDFFTNILETIEDSYVYTVFYEEKPIASMFCIVTSDILNKYKKTLNITWAATNSLYDKYYTNYFLYFEVIDMFIKIGIKNVDLGTCKINSSQYEFKKKWKPIFYSIVQKNSKQNYKDNKKMIFISGLWKKLPFFIVKLLGPKVRKYLV